MNTNPLEIDDEFFENPAYDYKLLKLIQKTMDDLIESARNFDFDSSKIDFPKCGDIDWGDNGH